ncbi:MAG TPA: phage holin family protein, partial [Candidatus Krumholzibacteria bacterium]|nr:phage holin family protein [Candidatus Krumholzibacteria bacterium]
NAEPPRGIFDSLRALFDTALSIVHNRAELFTTEIEEEVTRLVGVALWAFAAVLAGIIGTAFVGVAVLMVLPAGYRVWVAGGLGLLLLLFAGIGFVAIRRIARMKPRPFDASLRELEKDREHLRGRT